MSLLDRGEELLLKLGPRRTSKSESTSVVEPSPEREELRLRLEIDDLDLCEVDRWGVDSARSVVEDEWKSSLYQYG